MNGLINSYLHYLGPSKFSVFCDVTIARARLDAVTASALWVRNLFDGGVLRDCRYADRLARERENAVGEREDGEWGKVVEMANWMQRLHDDVQWLAFGRSGVQIPVGYLRGFWTGIAQSV